VNPIPIAIVGAGHLGTIHTRLLHQNQRFEVVGVVDPQKTARDKIKCEFDLPTATETSQLGRSFEAAVVATPTRFHHNVTKTLLDQGIHVLVEKPIAMTVSEADDLNAAAAANKATFQVGHNERFNPTFVAATARLPSAKYIEATRSGPYSFRSVDVGVVLDLMIHDLDLLLSLVQSPVEKVDAIGTSLIGEHEDMAQARIQFADGTVANLTASRCSFERQRWIRWFSEDGFVSANLDDSTVKSIKLPNWLRNKERNLNELPPEQQAEIRDRFFTDTLPLQTIRVEPANAIQLEHDNFCDSIESGQPPIVSGVAGRDALAVAEQILESIASHRWHQHSLADQKKAA